jgi:serine/threonine protein kinase/lipoprotein NlpI
MTAEISGVDTIICAAIDIACAEERAVYIAGACGGDTNLQNRVQKLVAAHFQAGNFLETPVPGAAATIEQLVRDGPGAMIGPFKLLEPIGEGGFGLVFLAEQLQPVRRKVAVKVLKPGMGNRQVIARFEAERQALALMDHAHICRVFDAGETASGRPYFAMELVRGKSITDYCDQNALTPRARLELFLTVCQAVQHAHHKGIIHRDIKPSNVLVSTQDGAAVAKVIDFGIAKAIGQQLTDKTLNTGFAQLIGTPLYMSPEQADMNGLDIDTRSDIYSLGVLLYELLTGSTPFDKERLGQAGYDEIRRIIREEEPARPSTRLSTMGAEATVVCTRRQSDAKQLSRLFRGELDWVVMKALEKDRARRYETAAAFAADIVHYLHDEPVSACPPSTWYRFGKFARHRRGALAMAAVITAALALVVGSVGWMARDYAEREATLLREQGAKEAAVERDRAAKEARLAGEKAAQEAALDAEATRALDEAVALIEASKWQAALAPVQRAHKLLVAAGRTQLPPRLQELQRDLTMLERLENILEAAKKKKSQHHTPEEVVLVNDEFTRAFRDFGIDVPALTALEAAGRIRARTPRLELAWALDYWSTKRKFAASSEAIVWALASGLEMNEALQLYAKTHNHWMKIDWKHLLEVAKAADPDPWRNRLRDAVIESNGPALKALAAAAPIRQLRPGTLFLLGNALIEVNDRETAFVLLRKAQQEYPADLALNETLGWLYTQTPQPGHQDEAVRFYSAALAVRPQSAYLHFKLGSVLLLKGSQTEARDEFSKAIELDPSLLLAWRNRGLVFLGMRRPEAIADFSQVIKLEPTAGNWYQRADAYATLGQWENAIADFSRAIEISPKFWSAYLQRGPVHAVLGQWDKAAADMDVAVEHFPGNERACLDLACYRAAAGDQERYAGACQKLIDRFGQTKDAGMAQKIALTCLLMPDALKDPKAAVQLAEFGAAGAPSVSWRQITRAASLYRQGKFEQAIKPLQEVLQTLPGNPAATPNGESLVTWLFLALAHQRIGKTDDAQRWLDHAGRHMDQVMAAKEIQAIRTDTPQVWAMCLVLRREAEGQKKK